jgi:hypothetical protein
MPTDEAITVESNWLPQSELDRLLAAVGRDHPGVMAGRSTPSVTRSLDPSIAVAMITAAAALAAPFVAKLAERVFAKEPAARLSIATTSGDVAAITAALSPEMRDEIIRNVLQSGVVTVQIGLDPAKR